MSRAPLKPPTPREAASGWDYGRDWDIQHDLAPEERQQYFDPAFVSLGLKDRFAGSEGSRVNANALSRTQIELPRQQHKSLSIAAQTKLLDHVFGNPGQLIAIAYKVNDAAR